MLVEVMALVLAAAFGGGAGWWARGRRFDAGAAAPRLPERAGVADGLELWDPHSCLNAINRSIVGAAEPLPEDHELYAIADHLKLLAQLSRAEGWATGAQLGEWLETLVALQQSNGRAAVSVSLPSTLSQLHVPPLGRAILPRLRHANRIESLSLDVTSPQAAVGGRPTDCRLRVRMMYRPTHDSGSGEVHEVWEEVVASTCRSAAR